MCRECVFFSEIFRVLDYRKLNDNTMTDAYDIPDKTDLINRIQGSKIFSKFDCESGFW